jgi:beta-lactamase regulating signal transducer with metallopeptidase domain
MEATLLPHFVSTSPAQVLIASIWQGLLLTACLWAGLRLASAFGLSLRASARFTLWLIAFLLVALLPIFTVLRDMLSAHPFAASMAGPSTFTLRLNPYWAFAFEAAWGLSSLFALARLSASALQMRSLFVGSSPVATSDMGDTLQAMVSRPQSRPVQIRLSDAADAPSVIGFFRPAVVLPRALWSELNSAELEQIVLHELAHLSRRDDWINLLQKFLRALSPLNPALLWAERHLCRERERACDDAVLAVAGNARAYATCLTKLAESRLVRRAATLAPGLWKRRSELAGRVDDILHRPHTANPLFTRAVFAASLLVTVSGAILLQRCPALIAFTGNPPAAAHSAALYGDLASARLVPAQFHMQQSSPRAAYHDAVFHTPSQAAPLTLAKHKSSLVKRHPRKLIATNPDGLRFVDVHSTQGEGQVFTVILFTVDVPAAGRTLHAALPLAEIPVFSLSTHWIAFQI